MNALPALRIDPVRRLAFEPTGIYVRALGDGSYESVDIAQLDKASLWRWLRSRGGENLWAENIVAVLLGHGAFEDEGP